MAQRRSKYPSLLAAWSRTGEVRGFNSVSGHVYVLSNPEHHPDFDPLAWRHVVAQVNCYTYALNSPEMGMSAPGNVANRRGQKMAEFGINAKDIHARAAFTNFTAAVLGAAKADGLEPLSHLSELKSGYYPVALFVGHVGGNDFHWIRQDSDGRWSHKVGDQPITRLDDAGNEITDPRSAYFKNYSFKCLFQVPAGSKGQTPAQRLMNRTANRIAKRSNIGWH